MENELKEVAAIAVKCAEKIGGKPDVEWIAESENGEYWVSLFDSRYQAGSWESEYDTPAIVIVDKNKKPRLAEMMESIDRNMDMHMGNNCKIVYKAY